MEESWIDDGNGYLWLVIAGDLLGILEICLASPVLVVWRSGSLTAKFGEGSYRED